jgi:hypothetical protein
MGIRSRPPSTAQLAARKSLEGVLREHQHLDAIELCAVTAHFLGQLIALQDQTKFTSAQVMELVAQNIEAGNQEVIDGLLGATGGTA